MRTSDIHDIGHSQKVTCASIEWEWVAELQQQKQRLKIFNIPIRSFGFVKKEHGSARSLSHWATKRYGEWLNALSRRRHSMYYATLARNERKNINRGSKVFSTGRKKNVPPSKRCNKKITWDMMRRQWYAKRRQRNTKNEKRSENLLEIIELGCLLASAAFTPIERH